MALSAQIRYIVPLISML